MKIQLVTAPGQVAAAARNENPQRTGGNRQNSNPKGQQKRQQGQAPQKKKELTAEDLDADLDAFISKTN